MMKMKTTNWPDTAEEFDAMTPEDRSVYLIEFMQIMATLAGVPKTCRLPKCRRAKVCATVEPPGKPGRGYQPRPVCLQDNANHAATVKLVNAFAARGRANGSLD